MSSLLKQETEAKAESVEPVETEEKAETEDPRALGLKLEEMAVLAEMEEMAGSAEMGETEAMP